MYPDYIVAPGRQELTEAGFTELRTPEDVEKAMESQEGTTLLMINSVCGCSAGSARPAVKLALEHATRPSRLFTAFAGVDTAAVARAREYLTGYAPSSPCIALFKDGKPVSVIERHMIEGNSPVMIAEALKAEFDAHC